MLPQNDGIQLPSGRVRCPAESIPKLDLLLSKVLSKTLEYARRIETTKLKIT